MAVMKWGTPPGGTHHDRQAHVVGHGEGVGLVHAVRGERVGGAAAQDTGDPNHGSAVKWSTAPYRGPETGEVPEEKPNAWGYRSPKRAKRCMANGDTCKGWATEASNYMYCHPHTRLAEGKPGWPTNEKPTEADLFDDPEPEAS